MINSLNLPEDLELIPISSGGLLVSRSFAVFCSVPLKSVQSIKDVMEKRSPVESLDYRLIEDLSEHGFFAEPRRIKPAKPSLRLQITNQCNLLCSFCCTDSGKARDSELSFDEWCDLLDEALIAEPLLNDVGILGGEPLLTPYFFGLAQFIQDKKLELTVFTNGVFLADPKYAEKAAKLIIRGAQFRVSFAGPVADSCDRLSGAPRFEQAMRGIFNLADLGALVTIDMMVFPETAEDTAQNLDGFMQRLPKGTSVSFGIAYCSGREDGRHMFESRDELEKAMDCISLESGKAIPLPAKSPVSYRREACHCAYGHDLHVRSDGLMFNCFKMEEPLGNYPSMSVRDGWQKGKTACKPAPILQTCKDCALSTLCGGGCRSENILYTGNGDIPLCGSWRKSVIAELLAENKVSALEWPTKYLINEAKKRNYNPPKEASVKYCSYNSIDREKGKKNDNAD